jgi:hypothetical protein
MPAAPNDAGDAKNTARLCQNHHAADAQACSAQQRRPNARRHGAAADGSHMHQFVYQHISGLGVYTVAVNSSTTGLDVAELLQADVP